MKWFRLYDELVDDPKVLLLSLELRWALIALWCVASQNDGRLPGIEHIAFKLRMKPAKAKKVLADLRAAGLVDEDENGSFPHNWTGRQYLSDSSAERVRRMRAKRSEAGLVAQWTPPKALKAALYERDEFRCSYCGSEEDLSIDHKIPELRGGTHDIDNLQILCRRCNAAKRDMTHEEYLARNGGVTLQGRFRNAPREQNQRSDPEIQTTQQHQNSEATPARPKCAIRPSAFDLAEELWQTAGFTKETLPPGWCGSPMAIDKWLEKGCPIEVIRFAVEAVLKRKVPDSFAYFERPIATAFANHKAPLPTVSIVNPQPIEVRNGGQFARPRGAVQVALDRLASLQDEAETDPGRDRDHAVGLSEG